MFELKEQICANLIKLASTFEAAENKPVKDERDIELISLAGDIRRDLMAHRDVFDSSKAVISRSRISTLAGTVSISYLGSEKILNLADEIKLRANSGANHLTHGAQFISGFAGLDDDYYQGVARHEFESSDASFEGAWCDRTDGDFIAMVEKFVQRASGFYVADIYSAKDSTLHVLGRIIIQGYASGHPFKALERDVERLSGQLAGDIHYREMHPESNFTGFNLSETRDLVITLEKALKDGAVAPEFNSRGARLKRGSISENAFYRAHGQSNGFIQLPTGQEPYTMLAVNMERRIAATYSEGDYIVAECESSSILDDELAHALDFYLNRGCISAGELDDLGSDLFATLPKSAKIVQSFREQNAPPVPAVG